MATELGVTVQTILTFLWPGRHYEPGHVALLAAQCARYQPSARFVCVSDGFEQAQFGPLVTVLPLPQSAKAVAGHRSPEGALFPHSYRRLWAFSEEAAQVLGDEVLLLDIDCLVVGSLDRYFGLPHDFVGWRPRITWGRSDRFGGGTWFHRPGTRTQVWCKFQEDPVGTIARAKAQGYRGSDQAILSHLLRGSPTFERPSGIYASQDHRPFSRRTRNHDWRVPPDARVIHFNGPVKPWESCAPFAVNHYRQFQESIAC